MVWRHGSCFLDFASRVVDDLDDAAALFGGEVALTHAQRHAEVLDGAHDLRIAFGGTGGVEDAAILCELALPFLGDGVELACALGGDGGETGLLEEGEHGVDDAGTGR